MHSLPTTKRMKKSKDHHGVYVVELDEAVLRTKVLQPTRTLIRTYLASILGMTGLDPEVRFENRKRGYKSNKYVQKYGLHLLPQIYDYYNLMSYGVAAAKEKSLAEVAG